MIRIDKSASLALYKQIVEVVVSGIGEGQFKKLDKLPSVNEVADLNNLSRDTVLMAYNELRERGLIKSMPGIGYFIERDHIEVELRIMLLFDEFNAFKEDLYNAFIEQLNGKAEVDIYFHHFNESLFDALLREHKKQYSAYVIMPANLKNAGEAIAQLPVDKVFLLDQIPDALEGSYPAVYQSFAEDMFSGLEQGKELLRKYQEIRLVYPGGKEPRGFLTGFEKFCTQYVFNFSIGASLKQQDVKKNKVYVLVNDRDLVFLVKFCMAHDWRPGVDIGIVSLNDTGLKEVVSGGITTISTDFLSMGERMARMVLNHQKELVKNPSRLIVRKSL